MIAVAVVEIATKTIVAVAVVAVSPRAVAATRYSTA
jgi:hypothetical protein